MPLRRPRPPLARRGLAFLGAVLVALAVTGVASAHAELVSSEPAANVSLPAAPGSVALRFSEPVDAATARIELVDARQGAVAGLGRLSVSGGDRVLALTLPDLDPGVYTVSYQVISAVDGHATAGSFAFLVDPSGTEPSPASTPSATSPSVDAPTIAARWVGLGASLVALGSLVAWFTSGRRVLVRHGHGTPGGVPWRLVAVAAISGLVGTTGYLLLAARPITAALASSHGEHEAASFALDVAAPFGWTPFAVAMRVAIGGLLVAALASTVRALVRAPRPRTDAAFGLLAGAALVVALGGMSMAAHAAALGGPFFGVLDVVHLLAVAAWLGGIPALVALARRTAASRAALGDMLRAHGPLALVAAPMVAATGLANSPLVLGAARETVASGYGNLLVAKAILLSVALGIGAVNHLALRSRGRAHVAGLVGAELVVAVLAIGAAATMVTIQPASSRPATVGAPAVNPAHLYGTAGASDVHVTVNLPAPGSQAYQASITDAETGAPRQDVEKAFLVFRPPAETNLAPQRVELAQADGSPGLFTGRGAYTPVEGSWQLDVVVRRRDALEEQVGFDVPVTSPAPPESLPTPDTGIDVPAPLALLWPLIPGGGQAWALAALAVGGAWLVGRVRRSAPASAARGALVAVAVLTVLAAGSRDLVDAANAPPDGAPTAAHEADSASVLRGEALYLANCAACHGRDGEGGPLETIPLPGSLPRAVRSASDDELGYRIANGVAGTAMPAFAGELTETERRDLVAYLRSRWNDE